MNKFVKGNTVKLSNSDLDWYVESDNDEMVLLTNGDIGWALYRDGEYYYYYSNGKRAYIEKGDI